MFVIAETWVNKVAAGPVIGGWDKKALLDLADDLRNCVEDLGIPKNNRPHLVKVVMAIMMSKRWCTRL